MGNAFLLTLKKIKRMNLLFATSELFPLIKTGGLADVCQSLPVALKKKGLNVTLVLPAYRSVRAKLPAPLAQYRIEDDFIAEDARVFEQRLPGTEIPLLLVAVGDLFDREGGPYVDEQGQDWPDNAVRFAQFCRVVVALLAGRCQPMLPLFDAVHCNDWQTGLIPALIAQEALPVRSLFTLHNLAYQGNFSRTVFESLALPESWWHYERLEFHGQFSFLKAGIVFADTVTTVSPTYAREILAEPLGCGMSGLLQHYRHKLHGILNGADYDLWNPARDPFVRFHYDIDTLPEKLHNKLDLQRQLGLRLGKSVLLAGMVSRLVYQKGVDAVLTLMQRLLQAEPSVKIQWIVLGSGEPFFEEALRALAQQHPDRLAVIVGYDEALAHRIEAACDLFLMPSRYEPCGLNQIYSLRYGTLPLVRATGGLADTVVDTGDASLTQGTATGFVYFGESAEDLQHCLQRAMHCFGNASDWRKIQGTAMRQRFGWEQSAERYIELYSRSFITQETP